MRERQPMPVCYAEGVNSERFVFIVRVWLEQDPQIASAVLRGSLQRLGSDEIRYFTSLEVLLELVNTVLSPAQTTSRPSDPGGDKPTAVP